MAPVPNPSRDFPAPKLSRSFLARTVPQPAPAPASAPVPSGQARTATAARNLGMPAGPAAKPPPPPPAKPPPGFFRGPNGTLVPDTQKRAPQPGFDPNSDPQFIAEQGNAQTGYNNTIADINYQRGQVNSDYGILDNGQIDPNDPFSRAQALQTAFDQANNRSLNSGYLYSGSTQNSLDNNRQGYAEGYNSLQTARQGALQNLASQGATAKLNETNTITGARGQAGQRWLAQRPTGAKNPPVWSAKQQSIIGKRVPGGKIVAIKGKDGKLHLAIRPTKKPDHDGHGGHGGSGHHGVAHPTAGGGGI